MHCYFLLSDEPDKHIKKWSIATGLFSFEITLILGLSGLPIFRRKSNEEDLWNDSSLWRPQESCYRCLFSLDLAYHVFINFRIYRNLDAGSFIIAFHPCLHFLCSRIINMARSHHIDTQRQHVAWISRHLKHVPCHRHFRVCWARLQATVEVGGFNPDSNRCQNVN